MKLLSAFGLTLLVTCSAMAQSPVAGQQPPPGGQHAGDLSQPLLLVPGSVADDATPLLGPPWGPPGWPNSPPDPSPPPKKKCYKTLNGGVSKSGSVGAPSSLPHTGVR